MMGNTVSLKTKDGQEIDAYVATPEGETIGALVVVQEIFGVNSHIRSIADGYAKDGFLAIAPALFDRYEKGVELAYTGDDAQRAYALYGKLDVATALLDVAAAFEEVSKAGKKVSVIGYCYGGLMSWISATRGKSVGMEPACTVGYYAGGIGNVAAEEPNCPVLLHFGSADTHIGPEQIEAVRSAHPDVTIYVYEGAEHGFNCDQRGAFNPDAAKLARERSLEFLKSHVA
jgi:carboxymethylenebutenolidase